LGEEGTLPECTNTLLRSPDKLRDWLSIADKHMQTYAENPSTFLLPRAHEFLKPLIERCVVSIEAVPNADEVFSKALKI
jgi:hypothetical protein